ncbi:hypothetical protein Tco_1023079 [Tanacetum coccineum]
MEDYTEKEELKAYLDVPGEEFAMDVESLSTKADGSSKNYKIFSEMIDDFDRQDVMNLHRLIKERYVTTSPEGYDLMLWGDLKTLFEPDKEDEVWRNQHGYNLISLRLIDSCGIHILLMDNGIAIRMMIYKITTSEVEECLEESYLTAVESPPSTPTGENVAVDIPVEILTPPIDLEISSLDEGSNTSCEDEGWWCKNEGCWCEDEWW